MKVRQFWVGWTKSRQGGERGYITGGSIVIDNEGYIDEQATNDANPSGLFITIDGVTKPYSAEQVKELGDVQTAEQVKELVHAPIYTAYEDRYNAETATPQEDVQDVSLPVQENLQTSEGQPQRVHEIELNPGDTYTINYNGVATPIEIVQDFGDGNISVDIDGKSVVMRREEIVNNIVSPESSEQVNSDVSAQEGLPTAQAEQPTDNPIPTEKRGKSERPAYHLVPIERTVEELYNQGLDQQEIDAFVQANINEINGDIEKHDKKAPVMGTDIAAYKRAKEEWANADADLKARLNYYNDLQKYIAAAQGETEVDEPVGNSDNLQAAASVPESQIDNENGNGNQSVDNTEMGAPHVSEGSKEALIDNQGNPVDENGKLIVEEVQSIDEITDEDFENPTRNVLLPTIPENIASAIGAEGRTLVIKKNVFEKNNNTHVELEPEDSRNILRSALYNPNMVGSTQPIKRPDYKVAVRTGEKNAVVVLDVFRDKEYVEIVGWRMINEKGLAKMQRQAEREGGQFLILSPSDGSAAALSALPYGSTSTAEDTAPVSNVQENSVKSDENTQNRDKNDVIEQTREQNRIAREREQRAGLPPKPSDYSAAINAENTEAQKAWEEKFNDYLAKLTSDDLPAFESTIRNMQDFKSFIKAGNPKGYKENPNYKAYDYIEKALKKRKRELEKSSINGGKLQDVEDYSTNNGEQVAPTISQGTDQVSDQADGSAQQGNSNENTLQNENNNLNLQQDNVSDNEQNQNDIPVGGQISESVPQGEHGKVSTLSGGAQETANRLRERIKSAQGNSEKGLREVENSVTREFAGENGLWIDNETELGTPFPSGDEHNNYIDAENQVVYKVNNRMHTPSILELLDRMEQHNKYFPNSKYSLVGFTSVSKNGDVMPVFAQDFVPDARMATIEEIDAYMGALGFTRVGDGRYSNSEVVVKDLHPRNVLVDPNGDVYIIDAEFENTLQNNDETSTDDTENAPIVDAETLQLTMSEEKFAELVEGEDVAAIDNYLKEIEKALLLNDESPLAGKMPIREDYRKAAEQYGGKENIPVEVMNELNARFEPYARLERALFDRKYALQNRLRELDGLIKERETEKEKSVMAEHKQTSFNGFLAGKTDLGASAAEKALNKKYRFDGEVISVAEFVEKQLQAGVLKTSTSEEPKYKGVSRRAWNRMDAAQQRAEEERVKNGGTKIVYYVNEHELGKTAYDYARFLLEKNENGQMGPFGRIYTQFKNKFEEAFDFLVKEETGDATAVLERSDIGEIDLVWGDEKGGLRHIIEKHTGEEKSFATHDDAKSSIADILKNGDVVFSNGDKVVIKKGYKLVTLRKNIREKGKKIADKNWVLTAYDETKADGTSAISDTNKGQAAQPADVSADKGNNTPEKKQAEDEKVLSESEYADARSAEIMADNPNLDDVEAYNMALDEYPKYIGDMIKSGKLSQIYMKATVGERIALNNMIQAAGYEISDVNTQEVKENSKKAESKYNVGDVVTATFGDGSIVHGTIEKIENGKIKIRSNGRLYPVDESKIGKGVELQHGALLLDSENPAFKAATEETMNALANTGVEVVMATEEQVQAVLGNEQTERQMIADANERFNRELDAFKEKQHKGLLHLGRPMGILSAAGVNARELTVSPKVLNRKMEQHDLTTDDLKGLAGAIQSPMLVYKHGEAVPNLVVVTELDAKGGKLSIALELDANGNVVEINNVSSVHSKDAATELVRLANMGEKGLQNGLRWVEKEKVQDWFGVADLNRPIHTDNPELVSVANVINDFENPKVKADFSRVYHGSGAKFDKFDHSFMGTGEGAQAYGWGTYVTEVEGIGKQYAESTSGNIFKSGFGDFYLKKIREGLAENKNFEEIKQNLLDYHANLYQKTGGNRELYGDFISDYEELQSLKEEDLPKRNLYTVEIPDDNGSNYLHWEGRITNAQKIMLVQAAEKEGVVFDFYGDKVTAEEYFSKMGAAVEGFQLYRALTRALGSDKAASEFLNRAGFVGVSMPAQATTGGRKDGARNYVIFNESDAQITDRVEFLRTSEGTVYGWTVGGRIYLTPDGINPNTPVHEYTHLWASAVEQRNPEQWKQVVDAMKLSPMWNEVMADEAYRDIWDNDNRVASEVLSRLSGEENYRQAMERAREEIRRADNPLDVAEKITAWKRVKRALSDFWNKVKEVLGLPVKGEIKSDIPVWMEFVNSAIGDFYKGVNPNVENSLMEQQKKKEEDDVRYRTKEKSPETALPEEESSFKGTAISSDDGAKIIIISGKI